jgi:hypothetical protein
MLTNMLNKRTNLNKSVFNKTTKYPLWNVFRKVKRHLDSLVEPTHRDYTSTTVDPNASMYTNMRQFQAYLTKNAYDMAIYNEYDLWPHTNFGTIDNPLLIFSADASWRLVICPGPGSEEESSSHEKVVFIIREGPIHRCMFCGQCFKLLRLRDDPVDEKNSYYSSVFTEISPKAIAEYERMPYMTFPFAQHDSQLHSQNVEPSDRNYVFANADEVDHLMVDPAKRMEFYKECEEDFVRYESVMTEINNQQKLLRLSDRDKLLLPKDIFERWYEVEKAIMKFDRAYNRYEKFVGRAYFDPENHERREKRMLERKAIREKDNYTYYFGEHNEQDQMFRDYYESDLEEFPDSEVQNEMQVDDLLRQSGDFDMRFIELVESHVSYKDRLPVEDIIEKSIFKYKYRKIADHKYESRNQRVIQRFLERAKERDPKAAEEIFEKLEELYVKNGVSGSILHEIQSVYKNAKSHTLEQENYEKLIPFAKYVAEEGLQQFKDYYETDDEEGGSSYKAELWKDLNEHDKLRFADCYDNFFNKRLQYDMGYVTIPKRPYDNKKSIVSNFVEDLLDFNRRVRPIQRTLAFQDATSQYQTLPLNETEFSNNTKFEERYRRVLGYQKSGKNLLDQLNEQKL